jgi:hypothetical protein
VKDGTIQEILKMAEKKYINQIDNEEQKYNQLSRDISEELKDHITERLKDLPNSRFWDVACMALWYLKQDWGIKA